MFIPVTILIMLFVDIVFIGYFYVVVFLKPMCETLGEDCSYSEIFFFLSLCIVCLLSVVIGTE